MRTSAVISLDALRRNWRRIVDLTDGRCHILAVVKGNAYGHGAVSIARALAGLPGTTLGTAFVEEAVHLRESGVQSPIVVLYEPMPTELEDVVRHDLAISVCSLRIVSELARTIERWPGQIDAHLRVDTGLGPPGVAPENLIDLARAVLEHRRLRVASVYTHLAAPTDADRTSHQVATLTGLVRDLASRGIVVQFVHAAGSVGLLRHRSARFTLVRPGTLLYGSPKGVAPNEPGACENVLTWRTSVAAIGRVPAGARLGYNAAETVRTPRRVATLPVGYADGFHALEATPPDVLIRGARAPLVSRPSMDVSLVDVTAIPEAQVGDEVVLLGRQDGAEILASELAARGALPTPEVWCRISARVPRVYTDLASGKGLDRA